MLSKRYIDAAILADGDFPTTPIAIERLSSAPFVVCCDGAANTYIANGYTPDIIIGDGDSISPENRERFKEWIVYNPDQQTNDLTKAVEYLIRRFGGSLSIDIVGATGKREDHTLANIALLIEYNRMGVDVRAYTDYGVFIPCKGSKELSVVKGAQISIFNINATALCATGLAYPIYDFSALWQGTLNEATESKITINGNGEFIVYVTYNKKEISG